MDTVDFQAEVGKMTIDYLLPLSKPSTRQVADIVYLKEKCWIARLRLTSLDLCKSRGIGHNVFYIETILRDPDHQRLIKIAVEGMTHFLVHNF